MRHRIDRMITTMTFGAGVVSLILFAVFRFL